MKHLLNAIACCLAVAGSAQTDWGFATLADTAAVARPAWIIYEPITAEYQDAVANALYGGWEYFDSWQEGWLPWLGLQNSGCFCADNGEEWAYADDWMEMYFSGQFPAPAPIEIDIHQTSQNLFEIEAFEVPGEFGAEYDDLEGWLIVPEASVGYHGGWRLEFMTVNCNPILCCNCETSICGPGEHERSFYVEPGSSIPEGWYLLFKLPESYASVSSPITDYWTSNAWSCIGCEGCTDPDACNYYDYDITDDSKCNYISCNQGCTDELACNFDAEATFDNATCSYALPGYTCDGTLATAFCGEGTVWSDALQQCVVADPAPVGEACVGDLDGDGLRAVSDLLLFLSVFSEPCSDQEVEENELSAIVFIECNADANGNGASEQDILTYMVEENFSGTWFGFYVNGATNNPSAANDMAIYMDWPGWINGTENNLIGTLTAAVPTESIGTDSFGNANLAHAFETIEIPQSTLNGQAWFSVWVPLQLLEESDLPETIMYNYNGQANSFTAAQVSSSLSSIDVEYSGPNWPHGTYRVFTSGLNAGLNVGSGWNASNYYLKGGD